MSGIGCGGSRNSQQASHPHRRCGFTPRNGHFLLQWWDPGAKRNLCERIDGDLIGAISAARRVEQRLEALRSSCSQPRRRSHNELITLFTADLQRRADAGEVAPATVSRYRSAIAHYAEFASSAGTSGRIALASHVDRQFALDFAAFLNNRQIAPNGHPQATKRRLRGQSFVLDAVRAMFEWAANPDRGGCLPSGFRNPFRRATLNRQQIPVDPLAAPDITMDMAVAFVGACDDYQRALFATMLLFGLRASEPVFLFREHIEPDWLRVGCIPELAYLPKGRRDKRMPLLPILNDLWQVDPTSPGTGLLFVRRRVSEGIASAPLYKQPLPQLAAEYERRCLLQKVATAAARQRVRDRVVRDAGGLTYDLIDGEFRRIANRLDWPREASMKDFRHLFASVLSDAGLPEHERRYLMGHAPSRDAITNYTHLINLPEHFRAVVESRWADVIEILRR